MPRCLYGHTTNRTRSYWRDDPDPYNGHMTNYQRIGLRIAISTSVGVLVASIAVVVAWRNIGWMSNFQPEQALTHQLLEVMEPLIETYCAETKTVPQSWGELHHTVEHYSFTHNKDGVPLDGWGHPLLYSVKEGHPVITSCGRDGKPGGIGVNHDLSSDDKSTPRENGPTFIQFALHPSARGVLLTCLACGIGAFWLSMTTVTPSALHGRAALLLVVKLALTILGTLIVAAVLSIFHIPNHH